MRYLLLLPLALLTGCDFAPGPGAEETGEGAGDAPALALYRRELLFLPESPDGPAAALAAQVRPASDRALRATHAWLRRGGAWAPLLLDQWEAAPLRQPWRILPHGALRVVLEDGAELESLIFGRGPDAPRLNPGPVAAEWTSGPEVRVLLREGELFAAGAPSSGLVLDVELGAPRLPGEGMGAALFLVDSAGAALAVVRLPETGLHLLTFDQPEADAGSEVTLETTEAGWRVLTGEGGVLADLEARGGEDEPERAPPEAHALSARPPVEVAGWVEHEGGRRPVTGLFFGEGR